jgi:hypothetical protein
MEGEHDANSGCRWDKEPNIGIIPRALLQLFAELEQQVNCNNYDRYTNMNV